MNNSQTGVILVVDDNEMIREPLMMVLERAGHQVLAAENGREALEIVRTHSIDLILLDIMMPEMDGYTVLQHLKNDPALRHIPVVVLSALDDLSSVVQCIKLGAEDYLFKPFDRTLLKARINASLEKKHWHDQEQAYLLQIEAERAKSDKLLNNILPAPISERLKQGDKIIADEFPDATVLFADLVDFTVLTTRLSPTELVSLLNEIFTIFDQLIDQYKLEKIKTLGDGYMVAGGLPMPRSDHAEAVVALALDMLKAVAQFNNFHGTSLQLRAGICTGPVIAGVIGKKKFAYDLWGDTVNIASRMESYGMAGCIQVSESTYQRLKHKYQFESRGTIFVKGKGELPAYILRHQPAETDKVESVVKQVVDSSTSS
ncbi:MAG: response regulator [Chloroflexi bacterium]|nr:MAG: response regulator [Chloroflexota bacterium]